MSRTLRFETDVNCYDGAVATAVAVEYTSPIGSVITVSPTPTATTLTVPGYTPGQIVSLKVRGTTVGAGRMALTCRIFYRTSAGAWVMVDSSTTDVPVQPTFSKELVVTAP